MIRRDPTAHSSDFVHYTDNRLYKEMLRYTGGRQYSLTEESKHRNAVLLQHCPEEQMIITLLR